MEDDFAVCLRFTALRAVNCSKFSWPKAFLP